MPDYRAVRDEARRLVAGLLGEDRGGRQAVSEADAVGAMPLRELDSFSLVELAVALEEVAEAEVLEELVGFDGETVDEFAAYVVKLAANAVGTGQDP